MLVSGACIVSKVCLMLFLWSKCCLCTALYTIKTKRPCILPCHIIINLYDIFLTRDSWGHFLTLAVVSFLYMDLFTKYIAPRSFYSFVYISHNFMYLQVVPDGCLNIFLWNFNWPCGCWPQSWLATKPLKKSTRFRDVKLSHTQSQIFFCQAVLLVSVFFSPHPCKKHTAF